MSSVCRAFNPLPLRERVAEGRVRGCRGSPPHPQPLSREGRGVNGATLNKYYGRGSMKVTYGYFFAPFESSAAVAAKNSAHFATLPRRSPEESSYSMENTPLKPWS